MKQIINHERSRITEKNSPYCKDRPREKLLTKGADALSDFELLQALIGSGNAQANVSTIARDALKLLKQNGANIAYKELKKVIGLGPAKITEILQLYMRVK